MIEVRYEDLVLETESATRKVVSFLGLPWEPALLRPDEMEHALFENPYNHPSIKAARQPINDAAIGRYRRDLTPRQIKMFNRISGKHLKALGYGLQDAR